MYIFVVPVLAAILFSAHSKFSLVLILSIGVYVYTIVYSVIVGVCLCLLFVLEKKVHSRETRKLLVHSESLYVYSNSMQFFTDSYVIKSSSVSSLVC